MYHANTIHQRFLS